MYISGYGKSGDHFGCIQRGSRAAEAGHLELPGTAGAPGRRYRAELEDGATVGVQASAGVAERGSGARAAQRALHVLSD